MSFLALDGSEVTPDAETSTSSKLITPEQHAVYIRAKQALRHGQNMFITGAAGTGKSHFLRNQILIPFAANIAGTDPTVIVTASTAIAAGHVDGRTIHSAMGLGYFDPNKAREADVYERLLKNKFMLRRYERIERLIVDEISMIHPRMLDVLDYCLRRIRKNDRAFGGVQVVFFGDYFQLPCIDTNSDTFGFDARCWPRLFPDASCYFEFTYSYRQREDVALQNMLDIVRTWTLPQLPDEVTKIITSRILPSEQSASDHCFDSYTRVFSRRDGAAEFNAAKLAAHAAKYREPICVFKAILELTPVGRSILQRAKGDPSWSRPIEKKYPATALVPEELKLCVGAFVMLVMNLWPDEKLVNGSQGIVLNINSSDETRPIITVAFFRTHSREDIDALSKLSPTELRECCRPGILDPSRYTIKDIVRTKRVVEFTEISHFPITLAYAFTIHKVQSLTISQLVIDATTMFAYGQFYVALSRATHLDTLYITNFIPDAQFVFASPKVIDFYSGFSSIVAKPLPSDEDEYEVEATDV